MALHLDPSAPSWARSLVNQLETILARLMPNFPGSGTYTPTLTGVTNVAASTAYACQYLRVGKVVHVSGQVDIDPTAGAATELGISLPIPAAFTANRQLAGTAVSSAVAESAAIRADATNDRAQLVWTATSTANNSWFFTFTYLVS